MSIKYMTCVWEKSKQEGTSLLLLLALADHANDAGICWPGIAHLAQKIRRTERQTKRLIQQLITSEELEVAEGVGRGHTNLYKILLNPHENSDIDVTITDEKKVTSRAEKVTSRAEKVTSRARKGDTAMSPESSITVKESPENLSPPPAENAPISAPEPETELPPTENPYSVSNGYAGSGDGQGRDASTGEYLGDVQRRAGRGASWTVPAEAGGSDGLGQAMLMAWLHRKNVDAAAMPEDLAQKWRCRLSRLAEGITGLTQELAVRAVETVLDPKNKQFKYYRYNDPANKKFQADFTDVALELLSGGDGRGDRRDEEGGDRQSRRSGRREYEPCTDAEQQAVWETHGEWMQRFVTRKCEELNWRIDPLQFQAEIGRQLGLSQRQVQALCEAFAIWENRTTEPLDVVAFFGDADA